MREIPKPFERYRHFKGGLYQILTLAKDSEDGRQMVVYQGLQGDYTVYVRSLEMFLSETDKEKYPQAQQRYRFEKVDKEAAAPDTASGPERTAEPERVVRPERTAEPGRVVRPEKTAQPGRIVRPEKTAESERVVRPERTAESGRVVRPEKTAEPGRVVTSERIAAPEKPASAAGGITEEEAQLDPMVLAFLDADTTKQKLEILTGMKDRITDDMINTLAVVCDVEVEKGPIEQRYASLKNCLIMKDRFEKTRPF